MRKTLAAAAAMLLMGGCGNDFGFGGGTRVQESGVTGQRNFEAAGFDRIDLAGPFDAVVTVGRQPSVRAEGDTGVMEHLDIRVEGGRLRIALRDGYSWSGDGTVTVHVTAPALTGANIAGSGDIRIGPLRTQHFAGSIAGSGNLVLEQLQAESAAFDIAGSGDIQARGTSRETRLGIAGSGDGQLGRLQAETARVSIAGSGDAEVHASGVATVEIVGSGDVTVQGGARCEVSKVGGGDVRCG